MSARTLPLKWGLIPLALYLLLAGGAACLVPSDYGGDPRPTPPDEGPHLGYIEYLAQHASLPVFRSQNDNYESHQPPLYYLSCLPAYLVAKAVFPGTTAGMARAGIVMVRLWSVLLSAISIWLAWLLGRRFFGDKSEPESVGVTSAVTDPAEFCKRRLLPLAPALFLALWPGRTMIVSALTNDALADSLCLLTFYLCLEVLAEGATPRRALLVGVAWALALMTKSTSLALGPIVVLAMVMRAVGDEPEDQTAALKRALGWLLWAAVPVVVLAGWWFVRNEMLYGDPLAAKVFQELFSKDRATPDYFFKLGLSGGGYFSLVVVNTALSFWGVFGQANVYQPQWYYVAGFAVWLAVLVGLVAQKVRDRLPSSRGAGVSPAGPLSATGTKKHGQQADRGAQKRANKTTPEGEGAAGAEHIDWRRQGWTLAWVLLVLVVAFFLRFNTEFYQAQARYLFAASGPIVLLLTLGLWDLDRRRYGLWAIVAALAVMLVMSLVSVFDFAGVVAAHNAPPFFGG